MNTRVQLDTCIKYTLLIGHVYFILVSNCTCVWLDTCIKYTCAIGRMHWLYVAIWPRALITHGQLYACIITRVRLDTCIFIRGLLLPRVINTCGQLLFFSQIYIKKKIIFIHNAYKSLCINICVFLFLKKNRIFYTIYIRLSFRFICKYYTWGLHVEFLICKYL